MSFIAKTILLANLSAAMAVGASAADFSSHPIVSAPSYDAPPAFNWEGAYLGVHGGLASPRANPFDDGKGFAGGVQAGYNVQVGPGVVGAELEGSYLGNAEIGVPGGKLEERFRAAAKAKAGLNFDRTLLYGTAGLAMTKYEDSRGVSGPSGWKAGYLVGGGVEQGFGGGLSAKIEYNYVSTGNVTTSTGGVSSKSDLHDHVVKAGLNYRF